MALVGEAHIVVRAITDRVNSDIRRGFNGSSSLGRRAGEDLGNAFQRGFQSKTDANMFSRISDGLNAMVPGAEAARNAYRSLSAAGYALGPAISQAISGISALIGSLGALVGSAGTAAGALATLGNAYSAIGLGFGVAKLAFGGIGKAISAVNNASAGGAKASAARTKKLVADAKAERAAREAVADAEKDLARTIQDNRERMVDANAAVAKAQVDLNKAIDAGRKSLKDLAFQAEDSALDEKGAALDLQKARANLAAVQDLPPNNQARQEAELAYQQADLAYREAKSNAADYAKQQNQATKTGVAGTQEYQSAAENLADAQKDQAKTARDAAQSQADAEERLAKARRAAKEAGEKTNADAAAPAAGGGGGADPFAGLNKYQKEFAQFILSLKPKLDELKLAASQAFLPPLQTAIIILVNRAFPTVLVGVRQIAGAMGSAAITIAKAITTSKNLSLLGDLFSNSAKLIKTFGSIIGSVFGIALSILSASAPLAQHLADAIADATKRLDAYFKSPIGNTALKDYFTESQRTLSEFGKIFGNIFRGFGGIIKANFGPGSGGDSMLQFFIKGTSGFADLNKAANQPGLRQYFKDTAANAQPILHLLGEIVKVFIAMGAQPSVGKTFTILQQAVPGIQDLATKLNDAGPALARLVVKVVDLFNALQDSGALKIFLDTLTSMVTGFDNFAKSPGGAAILQLTGRIFAFTLAFTVAGKAVGFFSKVIVGDLAHGTAVIGRVVSAGKGVREIGGAFSGVTRNFAGFRQAMSQLTYSSNGFSRAVGSIGSTLGRVVPAIGALGGRFLSALGPVGKIITVIGIVVGILITLYKTSDTFRNTVNRAFSAVAAIVGPVFDTLFKAIQPLIPVLQDAGQQIATAFAPIIPILANAGKQIVAAFAPLASQLLGSLVPALGLILKAVVPLIAILVGALLPAFTAILNAVLPLVTTLLGALVPVIALLIKAIVPVIVTIINLLVPVIQILADIVVFVAQVIANVLIAVLNGLPGVFGFVKDAVSFLAKGFSIEFNFISSVVKNVVNFIVLVVKAMVSVWKIEFDIIRTVISTVFTFVRNFITTAINVVSTVIKTVITGVKNTWSNIWNGIKTTFTNIWNGITDAVKGFGGFFHDAFSGIAGFVKKAFGGVLGAVKTPINGIISLVNSAIRGLNKLQVKVPKGVPIIGGTTFGLNIPTIPQLAAGGIVLPTPGGSIVNVAEAGRPEAITPLDSNGLSAGDRAVLDAVRNSKGSNVTIHLHPPAGADNAAIAAMVNTEISFRSRKGAVA